MGYTPTAEVFGTIHSSLYPTTLRRPTISPIYHAIGIMLLKKNNAA
jgi:hypothetical protein